eukprot:scaffold26939_cov20-Tisochrysis_lutea.AAC.3
METKMEIRWDQHHEPAYTVGANGKWRCAGLSTMGMHTWHWKVCLGASNADGDGNVLDVVVIQTE